MEIDDEGSLFGSPPPSPRQGRSPSPTLALPSSGSKNVGTIALPGSQCNSELAILPLALPSPQRSQNSSSLTPTPSCSRASSQAPSQSASKGKRKSRGSEDRILVRPPPPEIPLPDPSEPPPTNWLRSQSALLGLAGIVAGVQTTTLSNRHSRGSTAVNPIVIDEGHHIQLQHQPARLPNKPQPKRSTKLNQLTPSLPPIPPNAKLPIPSTFEIVQILIKQREVFPVLEDMVKLTAQKSARAAKGQTIAPSLSSAKPSFSSPSSFYSSSFGPALKRRKLSRVPAGAVDWDVPYPFKPGEGPQEYNATWERDREKQLVSQLLSLIKSASRKAAIRKYLELNPPQSVGKGADFPAQTKEKELEHWDTRETGQGQLGAATAMSKVDGNYGLANVFHSLPDTSALPLPFQEIFGDSSNSPTRPPATLANPHSLMTTSTTSSPAPESSPYGDLLTSLLSINPSPNSMSSSSSSDLDEAYTTSSSKDLGTFLANYASHESTPELDPGLIEQWNTIIETFGSSSQATFPHFPTSTTTPSSSDDLSMDLGVGFWNGNGATAGNGFHDTKGTQDDPQATMGFTEFPVFPQSIVFGLDTKPVIPSTNLDLVSSQLDNVSSTTFQPSLSTESSLSALSGLDEGASLEGGDLMQANISAIPSSSTTSYLNGPSSAGFMEVDMSLPRATNALNGEPSLGGVNLTPSSSITGDPYASSGLGLNISIPPSSSIASNLSALSGTPSLIHSPMPSLASFNDMELRSPELPLGELGSPNISVVTGDNAGSEPLLYGMIDGGGFGSERSLNDLQEGFNHSTKAPVAQMLNDRLHMMHPHLNPTRGATALPLDSGISAPAPSHPSNSSSRRKAELLKRARERRTQLAEEVVKARTQLWETTIEHGVLTRLAKHYS